MSLNSSSSSNASHTPFPPSSWIIGRLLLICFDSRVAAFSFTAFTITSVLILVPLCVLVAKLGVQRWREQHSSTTISHADIFTYHIVVTELLNVLGSTLICCGGHTDLPQMATVGIYLFMINVSGQMYFHVLTCVERYLAVVHPITYLSLRTAKGVRIRNITIGCVWFLCIAGTGLLSMTDQDHVTIISIFILGFVLIVVSFCSFSVLRVLIRPGPGEEGGGRQRVDQSKLRAFHTIMAILGVLLLRFMGNMLTCVLFVLLGDNEMCSLWTTSFWFSLPSSLVLPLLFLQRAGKLQCCKDHKNSEQRDE